MTCKIFLYPMTQCVLSSFSCCLRALQSTLEVKAKFLSLSLVITSLQGAVVQIAHTYFSSRKLFPRKKVYLLQKTKSKYTFQKKMNCVPFKLFSKWYQQCNNKILINILQNGPQPHKIILGLLFWSQFVSLYKTERYHLKIRKEIEKYNIII